MDPRIRGAICGIASAAFYGCNPLGALGLYELGINSHTVLFFRFVLASAILAGLMMIRRESFALKAKEAFLVVILGVIFCMTSLLMFISFHYIDAGVASTLIFVYPVMVALIMAVLFRERITLLTCGSIVLSLGGIALLYHGDGETLNTTGVLLVMLAAFFNALYIIVINQTQYPCGQDDVLCVGCLDFHGLCTFVDGGQYGYPDADNACDVGLCTLYGICANRPGTRLDGRCPPRYRFNPNGHHGGVGASQCRNDWCLDVR